MNLDFVKVPFTNNPSMIRLEGPAYSKKPNPEYIRFKKKEIALEKDNLCGETQLAISLDLRTKITNFLEIKKETSLMGITLSLEEDFALMYKGNMEIVSVCFPSGWTPVSKLGENLMSIHNPVADNEQLLKSSKKLSEYMCKQSIKRWVWTITTFPELSNFPGYSKPEVDKIEDLFFRLETQTSVPLDSNTSLFFIKVEVLPLRDVWNVKIQESINSMSENILNYKDLQQIKKLLNKI